MTVSSIVRIATRGFATDVSGPVIPRMARGLPVRRHIPGVTKVIAVSSAKGGVGKSTTSVNLAVALNGLGKRVGLLDADVFGPSIPLMMNLSGEPELSKEHKLVPLINYGVKCMSMGFLVGDKPVVWRGLMVMKGIQQLLWDVDWGSLDVLVVDFPPGTGDTQLSISQQVVLSGALIVTTPQDVALADATKGIATFQKLNVPILGLVENMSSFCCPKCHHTTHIFGRDGAAKVSRNLGVSLIAEIPLDAEISALSDAGKPITIALPEGPQAASYKGMSGSIVARVGLMLNGEELSQMLSTQEETLKTLANLNQSLEAFNNFAASRHDDNSSSIENYTGMLLGMKADLEIVFKRVRALKAKVAGSYPQQYAQVRAQNALISIDDEDD